MTVSDRLGFEIRIARLQSRVVVAVHGELDAYSSPELRHCLDDIVSGQGNLDVVLDLHGVTFIDSTALGVIVASHRKLRDIGGELTLSAPSRPVAAVLETTGVARSLIITAT